LSIPESVSASDLVDRFLARVAGLSLAEAAALWGVSPSYVSKLREGNRPERMQTGTRKALAEVVSRLEAESGVGRELQSVSGFDAGYAAAMLELIVIDARRIAERAESARARLAGVAASPIESGFPAPIQTPLAADEPDAEDQKRA
jgi:hypothetical protein